MDMTKTEIDELIQSWKLPEHGTLQERIEEMIRPAVIAGRFATSPTARLCGLQYHLSGQEDTRQLAELAGISSEDSVLDVLSYLGGPALQLAETYGCRVTGVDIAEDFVAAASRIAELAGLSDRVGFQTGDSQELPFSSEQFSVVWCQGLSGHDETCLREFDRVLLPGGRLAFTLATRGVDPDADSPEWALEEVGDSVRKLGYSIRDIQDITDRDIEIGWNALDRKLNEEHDQFAAVLGEQWVRDAHARFADEIRRMREGRWGNGRIVAVKPAG